MRCVTPGRGAAGDVKRIRGFERGRTVASPDGARNPTGRTSTGARLARVQARNRHTGRRFVHEGLQADRVCAGLAAEARAV